MIQLSDYLPKGVTVTPDATKAVTNMVEAIVADRSMPAPATKDQIQESLRFMARADGRPGDLSFRDYYNVGTYLTGLKEFSSPKSWGEYTTNVRKVSLTLEHNRNGHISAAKADLAARLGVEVSSIKIVDIDVAESEGPNGYRLTLLHGQDRFRYVGREGDGPRAEGGTNAA